MMDQKTGLIKTYAYDPMDRLTGAYTGQKKHEQYFYNRERLITEKDGGGSRSLMHAKNQLLAQAYIDDQSSGRTLLSVNRQCSVLHSVSHSHLHSQAFTPFGYHHIQQEMNGLPGFNGERPDSVSGHYHLGKGHRTYNPHLMRFNSPDQLSPFDAGGTNAYAYCKGDPINHVDPDGHLTLYPLKIQVITLDVVQRGRPRAPVNTRLLRSRSPSPPNFIPPPPPAPAARVPAHSVPVVTTPVGRLRPAPPPPDLMPPPPPVLVQTSRAPNSAATVSNTISSIRET